MAVQKIIGVTELQRRFRVVFDEVARQHVPYVLTRGSRPEAVLLPYEDYLRLQELRDKELLARFDQLLNRMATQNAARSEDEIAADVAQALAEVRAERRR